MKTTRQAYAESDKLLATMEAASNLAMVDPTKTYLVWKGSQFPNSTVAQFQAPAGCAIDWGDGTTETFEIASTSKTTHAYTDSSGYHLITISGLNTLEMMWFYRCVDLVYAKLSKDLLTLNRLSLADCTNLKFLYIGAEIAFDDTSATLTINDEALINCSSLSKIVFKSLKPPVITTRGGETTGFSSAKIVVPEASVFAYMEKFKSFPNKVVYETDSSDLWTVAETDKENTFTKSQTTRQSWWVADGTTTSPRALYKLSGIQRRQPRAGYLDFIMNLNYPPIEDKLDLTFFDHLRTGGNDDSPSYSRVRVVDARPADPATDIIYFVTES